jgi:hypothetical protein
MAAAVASLAACSPPATKQFDLHCQGTMRAEGDPGPPMPLEETFRIDLARSAFCADACKQVSAIKRIEPGRIVLQEERQGDMGASTAFNRVTGELSADVHGPGVRITGTASCDKRPFSGLPANRF